MLLVEYFHVRPKCKVLENHLHPALADGNGVDRCAINKDCSAVRLFEPCDQAKRCGFAAPAFPDDDEKFTAVDIEIGLIDGRDRAESFGQPAERDRNHGFMLFEGM